MLQETTDELEGGEGSAFDLARGVPLYNLSELDPHRHIKQNQEELAEMAAKIRDAI